MSIERELLKELSTKDMVSYYYPNLIDRIKELLAQPEPEQEVYAKGYAEAMRRQVYEAFEAGRKSALSNDWNKERDAMSEAWYLSETKQELLAQPEHIGNSNDMVEPVAWLHEWVDELGETVRSIFRNFYEGLNLIPLYTSPPTREPLSEELLEECLYLIVAFEEGCDYALYSNETGDAIELLRQKLGGFHSSDK